MDIALFIGFAAIGPVGVPVAVESAEQFKTIFGGDLPLVWDAEKGETVYGYLAPTVRSFFRNGGRRCWIIRVARLEGDKETPLNRACYNFFPLSGMARVRLDDKDITGFSPAFTRARARGSWSDELQLGAAVVSANVNLLNLSGSDSEKRVSIEIGANETISAGDLFRFVYRSENLSLLLAVDEIIEQKKNQPPPEQEQLPSFGKRIVEFSSKRFVWVKKLTDQIAPDDRHTVQVQMWNGQTGAESEITPQSFASERPAVFKLEKPKNAKSPQKVSLTFSKLAVSDAPVVGSLLFTKLKKDLIGLQVESVNSVSAEKADDLVVICRAVACQRKFKQPETTPQGERLTFEIRIKKGRENYPNLSDLAFNAGHERFWGNLPVDEELFSFSDSTDEKLPRWMRNTTASNFPLAGDGNPEGFYFPLFETVFAENYLGALPIQGTKLQRDGLESFDEDLFLDRKLKNTGAGNLLNEAEFIRYLSPRSRSLWGIHAALVPETSSKIAIESSPRKTAYTNYSLDECTIIAVPDAVHRGWSKTTDEALILSPPVFSPPARPEWWHFAGCASDDVPKVSEPPLGNFMDCGIRFVETPGNLSVKGNISSGKFTLEWKSKETDNDLVFVLEESASPKFEFAETVLRGKAKHFNVSKRNAGVYFYRVRAEIGKYFSDWSVGLAIKIPAAENWVAASAKDYKPDVLLAVQRALLRTCASRGDLFAVLDLPEHFDETEGFTHVGTLQSTKGFVRATAGVEPFSADETKALSYGAIYNPWLLTHREDFKGFRNAPPCGAMCGVMAKRADARGAWIAPANEALSDVYGLSKEIKRERFSDFQDNLINLVRQEPRGFLVLGSDTLSVDADLRSINVRRLLSLLRRLAVKHGAEYAFETNDASFRRQVQRGFTSLLDLMFMRGAFAGTTPANSYQVVVSDTLNNTRSVEQGRFIVELRVAPSQPLKFVTVRLVNASGRSSVTEVF